MIGRGLGLMAGALALMASGCGGASDGVRIEALMSERPPQTLAATGLFTDAGARLPAAGVLPYDLNTPLYSDGALKHRYVWMPEGRAAGWRETGVLDLPVGTVLVKTFAMPEGAEGAGGERYLETRLLVHAPQGWTALPYVWNADGTEATLTPQGATLAGVIPASVTGGVPADWSVPNRNQCKSCHQQNGDLEPIGPSAAALNRTYPYTDGSANQLVRWEVAGYLAGAPSDPTAPGVPRMPVWDDPASGPLADRARAYLAINCAHCHRPGGSASNSGLDLGYEVTDRVKLGVFKRPVAAGRGSGQLLFDVVPGDPDQSILTYRMASTDPGERMPELGRSLVHQEGLALVRAWIAQMPPEAAPSSAAASR